MMVLPLRFYAFVRHIFHAKAQSRKEFNELYVYAQ